MKRLLLFILFLFWAAVVSAQDATCRKSTEGAEFWFGFMESRHHQQDHYLEITVTSAEPTTFRISVGPDKTPFNGVYTVTPDNPTQVVIPWDQVEAIGSEEIQDKGIHLTSERPVNVYALNWSLNSADVAVIYPVGSLGKEYFAICYYPAIDLEPAQNGRNSEFLIVATEDETLVEITPSRVTDKGIPKDSTFTVLLQQGQVYQVQSENEPGTAAEGQGDLTGSHILASKPVAFYSGSLSTRIPTTQCCWDHLYEQIPPVHSWGREYYLAPLKTREQDRYRIMAAYDNTTVFITGRAPVTIQRGAFEEIVVYHDDPKRILADKPVLVAQYSQSRDVDIDFTGGDGDPFMIVLSPVNQSRNEITFVAYASPDSVNQEDYEGISKYFVNVVCATTETENIMLNGEPVAHEFQEFPEGGFSFARIQIEAGANHIKNLNEEGGFLAYVYGFGGVESFGYGAGFNLDLTLDLGESIEFVSDTLLLCYGDSLLLDAGIYFDTYLWNTGATTPTITVSDSGRYNVITTTYDGCELKDSVYVHLSRPQTELGTDYTEACMPFELELSAGDGYPKYLWQNTTGDTLSTAQTIIAGETGKYTVTVFDRYNCKASDAMELVIFPVPDVEFSGSNLVCGQKTTRLSADVTGTAEALWNFDGSVEWQTDTPAELTFSNETHTSVDINVAEWGHYNVFYHLKTTDGCERTDTFKIRFHPQPTSDFSLESDDRCEGYSQKLFFEGSATDSALFNWRLNGIQFLDTLDANSYLISVGAFLSEPSFISLYIDDNGCISDTAKMDVGATPNFTMEASHRRGCDELTVDFSSQMLTEDTVEYKWEFADGNTANTPALTKHYSEPGFYGVKLTITNPVTQCVNSFGIDSMIKVFPTPVAEISASPGFCYPDSALLAYTHSIDSSFCFWEFEGMHQTGGENDSVWVWFDEPVAAVRLTVDEYGCLSDPAEMELKRKPRFDIHTENPLGCPPYETEIYIETPDGSLSYEWITDSLPYPTDNPRYFSVSEPGSFDIGLIVHSNETGCSDTLIKTDWIQVYPNPTAGFLVDYPVAMADNARISFYNRSENAGSYFWEFGDGNSSAEDYPVHEYLHPGEYMAQLVAETLQGCTDTSRMLITVVPSTLYTPNAFRPDSPIEENRTFMPLKAGVDDSQFHLQVFDRQGQLVFESNSTEEPWNGTLLNGKPAPMGNYIWVARYDDIQGFKKEQKGQVLLIR